VRSSKGSPLIALNAVPPFKEYHFIDEDPGRAAQLRSYAPHRSDVHVYEGDCNDIIPKILPLARHEDYKRALCFLDPYGIDIHWAIVRALGEMKSAEIFLNFMVMDMNMNVLLHHPENAVPSQIERMNRFWGDESWRNVIYTSQATFFGSDEQVKLADSNAKIAEAYRKRLKELAGFEFVPAPLPFLNENGATIYYLFFASPNKTGHKIVGDIFDKYRRLQGL